jgi:hypothetical protein
MTDIEHGERLIDPNDSPALQALRHRPGHAPRACRHVENQLIAFEHEHFGQLLRQIGANLGDPPIELRGVRWVVEAGLVVVIVVVSMSVGVMIVVVLVSVLVPMVFARFMVMMATIVLVTVCVFVFVMMPASVIVFSFLCHLRVPF